MYGAGGRRGEHAADAGVGVGVVDVVLRLLGVEPDHPGADVHERGDPGGGPVAAGELAADAEEGAEVGLVAAEPGRYGDLVEPRVRDRADVLLDDAPVRLGLGGVRPQHRDEGGGPRDEVVGIRGGVGDVVVGASAVRVMTFS